MAMPKAESQQMPVRHEDFAARMNQAADNNVHVPDLHHGRLTFIATKLTRDYGIPTPTETVRRWFGGFATPRKKETLEALAQMLEVDPAWLRMGARSDVTPREQKLRNAEVDGVVNVIAGMIQMAAASAAFPGPEERFAKDHHVDIHAIIRGGKYAFHVALGERLESGAIRYAVPVAALVPEVIALGVARREDFCFDVIELEQDAVQRLGERKSMALLVDVDADGRTADHRWRRIRSFAERI